MGRQMDFSRPDDEGREGQDSTGGSDSDAPTRGEIEVALERILASRSFSAAPRQQALLRHIVVETIEGRGDRLKEFSIAVDVFGRSSTFDPRLDSIVRVQASRLRTQLAEFFGGEGAAEALRIEVPAGGYVASFNRAPPAVPSPARAEPQPTPPPIAHDADSEPPLDPPDPPTRRGALAAPFAGKPWLLAALLAAASLTLVILVLATLGNQPSSSDDTATVRPTGPSVFIAQYQLIDGPDYASTLRDGLQFELIDSLSRFPELSVLGIDTVYGSSSDAAQRGPFRADFILSGSVQANTTEVFVTSQLIRTATNQVVWSRRDTAPLTDAAGLLDVQSKIAGDVAGQLGQPYGVIQERLKEDLSENRAVSMEDYLCVLAAYDYARHKSAAQHAEVRACLEQVTQHSPGYSPAWAKLSWMYGDEERFGFNPRLGDRPAFVRAREAAGRAVAANASSAMAHQYLALAEFALGEDRNARNEIAEALRLNPNNSEILADAGQIYVLLGDLERGRELAEKAIIANPGHPPWYHGALAIYHVLKKNPVEALRNAQEAATDNSTMAGYMLAAALRLNGESAKADQALQSLYVVHPEARDKREELMKRLRLPKELLAMIFGS
jgi:adenylate cyclase